MARKPQTEAEKKARAAQKLAEESAPADTDAVRVAETASEAEQVPAAKTATEEILPESGQKTPVTVTEALHLDENADKEDGEGRKVNDADGDKAEIAALRAMIEQLRQQLDQKNQQPSIIQVLGDQEKVVMLFQAEVADDNLAVFGPNGMYGQVTGKTGKVIVPKSEWSRFYNESVRSMIRRRWLIVLSGMTDDERQLYDCSYREGELLEAGVFNRLLDMGDELTGIFPHLCRDHQEMVARRFVSAWMDGDARTNNRELIVKLNELSKQDGQKGLFTRIIEGMNAQDAK